MVYEYRMVQVPPTIQVKAKEERGNEAAVYLKQLVDTWAVDGWEF